VAVVLDLFSRKVVELCMGESLETWLVMQALEQALQRRASAEFERRYYQQQLCS
jgi:hypothetical protein